MSKINLNNINVPAILPDVAEQAVIRARNDMEKKKHTIYSKKFYLYNPIIICLVIILAVISIYKFNNNFKSVLSGEEIVSTNEVKEEFTDNSELIVTIEANDENIDIENADAENKNDEKADDEISVPISKNETTKENALLEFDLPLKSFYISADWQDDWQPGHLGIDLAAEEGAEIYAAADGVISMELFNDLNSFWNYGYGLCIIIEHGDGVSTLYGHCSEVLVQKGQEVKKGDLIAKVGDTGWSTGPHLHFEYRIDGADNNPHDVLDFSATD